MDLVASWGELGSPVTVSIGERWVRFKHLETLLGETYSVSLHPRPYWPSDLWVAPLKRMYYICIG